MSTKNSSIAINRLDRAKAFQLGDALKARKDEIVAGKVTAEQLAERITQEVKFLVTPPNIKSTCRALGFKFPAPIHDNSRHPVNMALERATNAQKRIEQLESEIKEVRQQIDYLHKALGLNGG